MTTHAAGRKAILRRKIGRILKDLKKDIPDDDRVEKLIDLA